jgi:hypothetical protein
LAFAVVVVVVVIMVRIVRVHVLAHRFGPIGAQPAAGWFCLDGLLKPSHGSLR